MGYELGSISKCFLINKPCEEKWSSVILIGSLPDSSETSFFLVE